MARPKKIVAKEVEVTNLWIDDSHNPLLEKQEFVETVLAASTTPIKEEKVIPPNVGRVTLYCQ